MQTAALVLSGGRAHAAALDSSPPVVAKRPATLEWAAAESIVAVGGSPITTASPFRGQGKTTAAFADVPALGSFFAPNLEYLQILKPDLIFCADWQQNLVPMLSRIAPVHVFDLRSPVDKQLDNAFRLTSDVGRLIGREGGARSYRQDAEARFDDLRARLRPVSAQPVLLGALLADGRHISVFGKGSLFDNVLARLGLRNAWTGPMNAWGIRSQGIEALAEYPSTPLLHLDAGAPSLAAMQALSASSLWNALPSVQHNRVKAIPFAWPYGGLPTALGFAESVAMALEPKDSAHGSG